MTDTVLTCVECKKDHTSAIPVCKDCYKELLSDKYDDFVFVLATLNDKLKELVIENNSIKEKLNKIDNVSK